jgi:hypothetical protein
MDRGVRRAAPPAGCAVPIRRARSAIALLGVLAIFAAGCDTGTDEAFGGGDAAEGGGREGETREAGDPLLAEDDADEAPRDLATRRGLGSMTARVPGTTEVISGVRLDAHRVRVTIHDGFARTEVEEEFFNETDRVLEGRYVFPLPPGATVTRLGLWVGSQLVEGEIVERRRAAQIFRGIVEDTVRPRDPALLEWVRGGEVSLKIFPIPAKSARKVILAYDEALDVQGGKVRYVHPLSMGSERATKIGDFQVSVHVVGADGEAEQVRAIAERDHVPSGDLVVEAPAGRAVADRVVLSGSDDLAGPSRRFFTASLSVPLVASPRARDRVLVLDTSESQTLATLEAQARAVRAVVRTLADDERFAVLACATRCTSFPATGLASREEHAAVGSFLDALRTGGASDLAAAIARGASRLARGGQVVLFHDGKASAGELAPAAIAERTLPVLSIQGAELRVVGVGTTVDELALGALGRELGASYEPLAGEASLDRRTRRLAHDLARPVLANARVELPEGYGDVVPASFPSLVPGRPLRIFGTADEHVGEGVARIVGDLDGETVEIAVPLGVDQGGAPNPLVPKLWADRAIAELEAEGDAASRARVVALSTTFHVLSRQTSLLVLENERMFAEFGVKRTTLKASDQADHGFGGLDLAPPTADAPLALWGSGDGAGAEGGAGFGSGSGRLAGSHKTKAPQVRMGASSVSGRLPPESIQRIVRQNFGRYRACYEAGLRKDPGLAGRVVVHFVIGRDGTVGAVSNGGSDLPDAAVIACILRGFSGLSFPQPEGGIVTVTYPIVFASDGTRPSRPVAEWPVAVPEPSAPRTPHAWEIENERNARIARERYVRQMNQPRSKMVIEHHAGTDAWRTGRADHLAALERAASLAPESRQKRARFVNALLGNGRFEQARDEAARFVELDPDLGAARELLAQSAAASGDHELASSALEALAEAEPRSTDAHLRAARAFEAAGDLERACAHHRTLAELGDDPTSRALAAACWETIVGDGHDMAAVSAARAKLAKPPSAPFEAKVTCEDAKLACPDVAVLTPAGRLVSRGAPWQAIPIDGGVALTLGSTGTYRTILVGGDPRAKGKVTVKAHGRSRDMPFDERTARTAVVTTVDQQWLPFVRW